MERSEGNMRCDELKSKRDVEVEEIAEIERVEVGGDRDEDKFA